jgi:hypothetical protein
LLVPESLAASQVNEADIDMLFERSDLDHDGKLDEDEIVRALGASRRQVALAEHRNSRARRVTRICTFLIELDPKINTRLKTFALYLLAQKYSESGDRVARVGAIYTSDAARHDVAVKMIKVADELGDHDGKVRAPATCATLHTRFEMKI